MKLFLKSDLPRQIQHIKHGGISIRRRFIVYIISAIVLVLSLILLLLNANAHIVIAKANIANTLFTGFLDTVAYVQ